MFRSSMITLISMSAAGAAYAAGPQPVSPEPMITAPTTYAAPAASWEGGYVGGQLGYAYGEFDPSLNPNDFDGDSVIGGIYAGYLWSLGNGWYAGPEFSYDFADLSVTDPATNNTATFEEIARLKAVVGHELGANGLLYGSAGLAYGSVDGVGTFFDGSDSSYVVGLGYDYRINDQWTAGIEYQYHDFDAIGNAGGDVAVNTLHAKVGYRF